MRNEAPTATPCALRHEAVAGVRTLSIIIPCFNEEATLAEIVARAQAADIGSLRREIIVVDDGSRDGTRAVLAGLPGVRALFHEGNRGKGAAVKTGFAAADGDVLLIQDADLEYSPSDYAAVLEPILSDRADAVMGSRFARGRPGLLRGAERAPSVSHYFGNMLIVLLTNFLYGLRATDCEAAYKAFRAGAVRGLPIEADGFDFDNELLCKLMRRGARIVEVPIRYAPRGYREGKKIRWTDGVRMLWTTLKWRFRSFAGEPLR